MSCISISPCTTYSFLIPFFRKDSSSCWSLEDEVTLTSALATFLASPVPKVWQNGLYDRWVLQYGFSMPVYGNTDDTMLKWWEKYCELEKNLGMQTSVLTDEPYYKGDRKSQDDSTFFSYCCKDSAVTYEINQKLETMLSPSSRKHYEFNHCLLNLFLYIELRGILYDRVKAKSRLEEVQSAIHLSQGQLDRLCNCGIPLEWTKVERELETRSVCAFKKDSTQAKKDYESTFEGLLEICRKEELSVTEQSFLAKFLGCLSTSKVQDLNNTYTKTLLSQSKRTKTRVR
jgi:DNA polymerase I-like protein with 3'-5' exonuclease and polymerase domains